MSAAVDGGGAAGTAGTTGGREQFGARLQRAMKAHGPLCLGIDPHPGLLAAWGLADDGDGLAAFADTALEAFAGVGAAVKPQSAFFERHGSRGVAVLERLLADASSAGVLTIADVKRGDIGSTMGAYAQAYLAEGSPLAADAVTVSPYLGFGSLDPALALARATGRGVFVLCLTSNPEGAEVQRARTGQDVGDVSGGATVAARIAAHAAAVNAEVLGGTARPGAALGPVGLVVGATVGTAVQDQGIDLGAVRGPLLAPGFGAQGAGRRELTEVYAGATGAVVVSTSRGVLQAGPDRGALRAAAEQARDEVVAAIGA